jgi:hypothetical protein
MAAGIGFLVNYNAGKSTCGFVFAEVLRRGDRNVRLSQAAQYAQIHNITVPVHELMSNDLSVADRPDPLIIARAKAEWVAKFPNKTP